MVEIEENKDNDTKALLQYFNLLFNEVIDTYWVAGERLIFVIIRKFGGFLINADKKNMG